MRGKRGKRKEEEIGRRGNSEKEKVDDLRSCKGKVVVVGPYLGKDPCKHQCVWFTFTLLIQFKINLIVVHWSAEGFINYDCLFSVPHLRIAVHLVSCRRVRT